MIFIAVRFSIKKLLHVRRCRAEFGELIVQQPVELRPDLILLRAGDMAKSAFLLCLHLGGRSLRLEMIEIEVPTPRVGKALRVLDGHVCAIERAREITSSRRLISRAIRVFPGQCELQLLEQDCALGNTFAFLYISHDPGSM